LSLVRLVTPGDDQEIAKIIKTMIGDLNPHEVVREVALDLLGNRQYFGLVFDDEEIKGFGALKLEPFDGANGVAEIAWLGVQNQNRRKGVGSAIVRRIEQHAKEHGIRKLYVKTNSNNKPAICFWIMQNYKFEACLLDFGSKGIDYYFLGKEML